MIDSKHSPEPWRVDDQARIVDDAGNLVLYGVDLQFRAEDEAEVLRRIVACVNACAGIQTEALEAGALDHALRVLTIVVEQDGPSPKARALLRRLGRLP